MILGVRAADLVMGMGLLVFVLLVAQALLGTRRLPILAKRRLRIHRALGWILVVLAGVHGLTAAGLYRWGWF